MKKKILVFTIFISVIIVLSYFKEFFFLSVNGILSGEGAYKTNVTIPDVLIDLSPTVLLGAKYALGGIVIFLDYLLLKTAYKLLDFDLKLFRTIQIIYMLGALFVITFHLISFFSGETFHSISLYAFKIMLSPIFPIVLLILGQYSFFNETNDQNKRNN